MSEEEEQVSEIEMEEPKVLPLVEEGDYAAKVSKIKTNVKGAFGLMVVIEFDVGGTDVPALASQNLNENTKLYSWYQILTGEDIKVGQKLRFKDLIGKKAKVTVRSRQVKDNQGKPRVDDDGNPVLTSVIKELRQAK